MSIRILYGNRGISPTIAIILLVMISVALATLLYVWIGEYMGGMGTKAESSKGSGDLLKIEGVKLDNNKLLIYIRNIGSNRVNVDRVFLEKGGLVVCELTPSEGGVEIDPGEVMELKVELTSGLKEGRYTIKVGSVSGVVASSYIYYSSGGGEEQNWLEGWKYRRRIVITELSGNTLTDFQVKIVLTPDNFDYSKVKSNGEDIRFTDDDGTTLLSYWIEQWNPVGESIIWVKVPSIPASSSTSIYIYYGNPTANSKSNGDETFEFFDDFIGDSLDESKWITNTNQYSVENGHIKMWGDWNGRYYINTRRSFSAPVVVEGRWRLGQVGSDTDVQIEFMKSMTSPAISSESIEARYDGEGTYFPWNQKCIYYGPNWLRGLDPHVAWGPQIRTTTWQKFMIKYTESSIWFWDSWSDSVLEYSNTMFNPFYLGIVGDTDSTFRYGYIDYIFIRKYSTVEPVVSIGSEESRE